MKEFNSIFYENTILDDGTILEGANWDSTKGAHIYKKKMRALKKELKQNVKAGKDKEAIKNISDMEKEIKNFKSEMSIIKDDQTTGEVWIGILIYTLELIPATLLTLPLGGIGSYVIAYKDIVKLQKRVDEDIKAAGGPNKYAGKTEDMNIYIGKLRGALNKYEDYLKKVKRILKKRGSLKENSIMDYDLI